MMEGVMRMPGNVCAIASNSYESEKNARLVYKLMGLGMAGAVLHVGAHPDDEDMGCSPIFRASLASGLRPGPQPEARAVRTA